jgi:hypothetical protein
MYIKVTAVKKAKDQFYGFMSSTPPGNNYLKLGLGTELEYLNGTSEKTFLDTTREAHFTLVVPPIPTWEGEEVTISEFLERTEAHVS